jgi:eukaryotic-like serine/threonine-protein kinase
MTDWKEISRLCGELLRRDGKARRAFLDEVCVGDSRLRMQLGAIFDEAGPDTADALLERLGRVLDELRSQPDGNLAQHTNPEPDKTSTRAPVGSSPFSVLDPATLGDLLSVMHLREYSPGECLIRQGDPAEFLLLLLTGTASARVQDTPAGRPPIGEFGPGDIVGEMSLLTNEPRTAGVVADTFVRSLELSTVDFHMMTDRHPDLRVVLTDVMASRLGAARFDGLGGKDIHGYRIVQCIGRGGMGVVYEARNLTTGETVALKMMSHPLMYRPSALRRFRREAVVLRTLEHPSLVQLYDRFSAYKTEFLAMEFCYGSTLAQVIASRGRLKEQVVRGILGQLAAALTYIHGRGVVHLDVKPSNVMLPQSGSVKLLDFGIVTVDERSDLWQTLKTDTSLPRMLGTPRYMAPERFSDRGVDRRADLYGLACVAFEALSGRPVVKSSNVFDIIREQAQFTMPPREEIGSGVSLEMHEVLLRGLAQSPDNRTLDLDKLALWAAPVDLNA